MLGCPDGAVESVGIELGMTLGAEDIDGREEMEGCSVGNVLKLGFPEGTPVGMALLLGTSDGVLVGVGS